VPSNNFKCVTSVVVELKDLDVTIVDDKDMRTNSFKMKAMDIRDEYGRLFDV
jgi:hypothetical protein